MKDLRRRRFSAAVIGVTIASLLAATGAHAVPTWLAPVPFGPRGFDLKEDPRVVANARGDVIAAWSRHDKTLDQWVIEATVRPAGGSFSTPQMLSTSLTTGAFEPDVGIDGNGNAVAVWQQFDTVSAKNVIRHATRPAGQSFGAATTLTAAGTQGLSPDLAMNGLGAAVVVWVGDSNVIEATSRAASGQGFGEPADISGTSAAEPRVAIDPNGNAVAVWRRSSAIEAAAKPGGSSTFTAAASPLSATSADRPQVAISPQGRATAVWRINSKIEFAERGVNPTFAAGTWTPAGAVSEPADTSSFNPQVGLDADNTAVAVYLGCSPSCTVKAAVRASGGPFVDHQTIPGPGGSGVEPRLAVSPNGDALAVWRASSGSFQAILASRRSKGGDFAGVAEVLVGDSTTIPQNFPDVAIDGQGNGAAVWEVNESEPAPSGHQAQVAGFDAAGPDLGSPSIPASGVAGTALSFSASPFDVWSTFTTGWQFGDSGTASGTEVSHTYEIPGTYTVTLTATDAVGNASTQTRTVAIAAAPTDTPAPTPPGSPAPPASLPDRDGDGFNITLDCDDNNPAIHPRTREILGNPIDENCDGRADPFPAILSPVQSGGFARGARTIFRRLRVRSVPAGGRVELRCRGRRCSFRRRSLTSRSGGNVDLVRRFGRRGQLTFRAGQVVEVWITAPAMIGKVVRYRIVSGKFPAARTLCAPAGANVAQPRC